MRTSRRMLRQARNAIAACLFLSGLITVLMLATPYVTVLLFQTVLPSGNFEILGVLALIAIGAAVARSVTEAARDTILLRTGLWLDHHLGEYGFANGLKRARATADLTADHRALGALSTAISGGAVRALLNAIWAPALIAALFAIDTVFGSMAVGGSIVFVLLSARMPAYGSSQPSDANTWVQQVLAAPAGIIGGAADTWERLNRTKIATSYSFTRAVLTTSAQLSVLAALSQVAVLCAGIHLLIGATIGAGHLLAALLLINRLAQTWTDAAAAAPSLRAALKGYRHLMALPSDALDAANLGPGPLSLTDASVVYPGRSKPALHAISIAVSAGRCLVVNGGANAGKSTLLATLAGALEPITGSATIGGQSVAQLQRTASTPLIGFAPASPIVLSGTVAQNIAGFATSASMPVATAALRAGVHAMIADLPNGYETTVGEGGALLSPRERSAVSLARALCGSRLVCVLDQPELALDDAGVRQLTDTLRAMQRVGTAIVLATQDPRLADLADEIAHLEFGRITRIDRQQPKNIGPSTLYEAA
jgi:ATP-binding cassette, subfamily C, bacterial